MSKSTIEKLKTEIGEWNAKIADLETRRVGAESAAASCEENRKRHVLSALAHNDAKAQSALEDLTGKTDRAARDAKDFGIALAQAREKLADLQKQLARAEKTAQVEKLRDLVRQKCEFGKQIQEAAQKFIDLLRDAVAVDKDLGRGLYALDAQFPNPVHAAKYTGLMSSISSPIKDEAIDLFRYRDARTYALICLAQPATGETVQFLDGTLGAWEQGRWIERFGTCLDNTVRVLDDELRVDELDSPAIDSPAAVAAD